MRTKIFLISVLLANLLLPTVWAAPTLSTLAKETETLLQTAATRSESPIVCQGRLTLESGVPVSTTDQTAKTTVYFTPYLGSRISLYDGTKWVLFAFTETSLALGTITSASNYDVWMYDNGGTPTLELTIWTNDTTRATALAIQDGIYVKTGATTRRYLGTIRTTSTTTTEDSLANRFVYNYYNRVPRALRVLESTDSWTYATATVRSANASTANRLGIVQGILEDPVQISAMAVAITGSATAVNSFVGIAKNATSSANSVTASAPSYLDDIHRQQLWSWFFNGTSIGYYYMQWVEYTASDTTTFYGDDAGDDRVQSGIMGLIKN